MSKLDNTFNFKGKRITVMGLGLHSGGLGVIEYLHKQKAKLLVTDIRSSKDLAPTLDILKKRNIYKKVTWVLGQHRQEDFTHTDFIIKNPGVPPTSPYIKLALKNKIPVITDLDIFFKKAKGTIIGITGTRGKSTTTTLIQAILQKSNSKKTFLGGNIRISVLGLLDKLTSQSYSVLELSSFQLENITQSPHVAVITSFMEDHLNRYSSVEHYFEAKKNIFKYQQADDILVLNYDDEKIRSCAEQSAGEVLFFSRTSLDLEQNRGAYVSEGSIFFGQESKPILPLSAIKIIGDHNISNILAAVTVCRALGVASSDIQQIVSTFKGVPGRLEHIQTKKGILFINDTTSTIPEATYAALESFSSKNIHLICGGADKKIDYSHFAEHIKSNVKTVLLLPGEATDKMQISFKNNGKKNGLDTIQAVSSMKQAVITAYEVAQEGDVILLSPGASSFGLFLNEFDRGDAFIQAVKQLV